MDVLVTRYHGKLLDFALRQLRDREAAADVAQAALVRAFESAARFDAGKATFRTWLYTIALNLVREDFRRKLRRNETSLSDLAETADSAGLPEDQAVANELWDDVGRLREEHSVALVLRFRHELSYDEIADVMNVPAGTVRSWVHYALKSLRASFEPVDCKE
jgi:RNA polymerase sigma-70 factor (ECF subfamily)